MSNLEEFIDGCISHRAGFSGIDDLKRQARYELARLRAERDELRAMLEKHTREWYCEVSNDYDHEAPKWAHDLAKAQSEERAIISRTEGGEK